MSISIKVVHVTWRLISHGCGHESSPRHHLAEKTSKTQCSSKTKRDSEARGWNKLRWKWQLKIQTCHCHGAMLNIYVHSFVMHVYLHVPVVHDGIHRSLRLHSRLIPVSPGKKSSGVWWHLKDLWWHLKADTWAGVQLEGYSALAKLYSIKKISLYQSNSILWFLYHMNHAMQHWHLPFLLVLCLLSCLGLVPAGSLLWIGDSSSQMFPSSPLL